jgi:hypothetical protein
MARLIDDYLKTKAAINNESSSQMAPSEVHLWSDTGHIIIAYKVDAPALIDCIDDIDFSTMLTIFSNISGCIQRLHLANGYHGGINLRKIFYDVQSQRVTLIGWGEGHIGCTDNGLYHGDQSSSQRMMRHQHSVLEGERSKF